MNYTNEQQEDIINLMLAAFHMGVFVTLTDSDADIPEKKLKMMMLRILNLK